MYKAIVRYKNAGLKVELGSYADYADAVNAIKASYLDTLFSSTDAQAFMRSTSYDSIRMEGATDITAWDGSNDLSWYVELA